MIGFSVNHIIELFNYLISGVNWVDVKVKTTLMGATSAKVYKLNEKVAVEYGAEFISEFFLYALGTALLLYEYGRSVAKDEAKELKLQQQSEKFKSDLDEVKRAAMETTFLMEEQSAQIRALQRQLGSLHTQLGDLKSKS